MGIREFKEELKILKIREKFILSSLNSTFYYKNQGRNEKFEELKEIRYKMKRIDFQINLLKARNKKL